MSRRGVIVPPQLYSNTKMFKVAIGVILGIYVAQEYHEKVPNIKNLFIRGVKEVKDQIEEEEKKSKKDSKKE